MVEPRVRNWVTTVTTQPVFGIEWLCLHMFSMRCNGYANIGGQELHRITEEMKVWKNGSNYVGTYQQPHHDGWLRVCQKDRDFTCFTWTRLTLRKSIIICNVHMYVNIYIYITY